MGSKGKITELEDLLKSKKVLTAKAGRIERSLEFSKYEDKPKKIKALTKLREKVELVEGRIKKLCTEI